ncbi:MAG: HNH endonuclease [Pseudomonadota bacterium]
MPHRPARPCRYPRCPALTNDPSGYCPAHLSLSRRQQDRERGTAAERGYDWRWHKASRAYLAANPLCAICLKKDPLVIRAASLVDHKIPHKGDMALFWDESNWQSSCEECHRLKSASEDGAFGNPRRS